MRIAASFVAFRLLLLKTAVSIQPATLPLRGGHAIESFFGNKANNGHRPKKREAKNHVRKLSQIRRFGNKATKDRDHKPSRIRGFGKAFLTPLPPT